MYVFPLEPQRIGLARAGVEQEAQCGDGHRMVRLQAIERATERGELVVRQVVRLEASLAALQSFARAGVLAPQAERPLNNSAVAVPVHDPRLAPVRSRAPPLGNTQDTPGNGVGFGVRKDGSAALKRRAGCNPL